MFKHKFNHLGFLCQFTFAGEKEFHSHIKTCIRMFENNKFLTVHFNLNNVLLKALIKLFMIAACTSNFQQISNNLQFYPFSINHVKIKDPRRFYS